MPNDAVLKMPKQEVFDQKSFYIDFAVIKIGVDIQVFKYSHLNRKKV